MIVSYEDQYANDFATLNFEWLAKYFYIEEYDELVLNNPKKYILDKGGHIFFFISKNIAVATVALINREEEGFELSKMAVTSAYQGLKIGQKLMYYSIYFAIHEGIQRLYLDSNTKLTPAIKLYTKVGFREIAVPDNTPYERCNIRMELIL